MILLLLMRHYTAVGNGSGETSISSVEAPVWRQESFEKVSAKTSNESYAERPLETD